MLANLISSSTFLILFANNIIDKQGFEHAIDLMLNNWFYRAPIYLFNATAVVYFLMWFYVHGGQTIGMRAWRLQIRSLDGTAISYKQAVIRLASGLFGVGNFWIWLDKNRRSLQDIASKSEVLFLTKEANKFTEWKSL